MEARACKQCKKKTKSYYLVSPKTCRCSEVVLCDQCYEDQARRAIFDRAVASNDSPLAVTNWSYWRTRQQTKGDVEFMARSNEPEDGALEAIQDGMEAAADDLAAAADEEEAT